MAQELLIDQERQSLDDHARQARESGDPAAQPTTAAEHHMELDMPRPTWPARC
jgi:hypothetical protein